VELRMHWRAVCSMCVPLIPETGTLHGRETGKQNMFVPKANNKDCQLASWSG